jgi:alpha-mannosidase
VGFSRGDAANAIQTVIRPCINPRRAPLGVAAHHLRGEPIAAGDALRLPFEPFRPGGSWGGIWGTTWFQMRGVVPGEWAGEEVAALIHLGGREVVGFTAEGLIYDTRAMVLQGLHHRHRAVRLLTEAAGGEPVEFYVEAAANPIPKWHVRDWPLLLPEYDGPPLYTLEQAELATVDPLVRALYFDARAVLGLARLPPYPPADGENGPAVDIPQEAALAALQEAISRFDPGDSARTAGAARVVLAEMLSRPSTSTHKVTAVGHAHIDTAWLWPIRETKRKCARTFSNQLRVMERYPEHRFACSQAVQYAWMKEGYPELYSQIRRRVAEGRWLPVGGMWVEPDSNLPSGESLVRQLVHGKRFFIDEFGVETRELWIPDVFGYSAALPQIANQAGVDSLITQKMSWNDTNTFPHSTFWWEGHDGSRLLAHFPPADTYNGDFSAAQLAHSEANLKDRHRSDRSLYPFGYGDGGGGPNDDMLEQSRRLPDVAGLPRSSIGTVEEFFAAVRDEAAQLSTWTGELYLEFHRGTYTTHADVKLANRRAEEVLRAAEMWTVAAGIDRKAELDDLWKTLLLHQFHDIIPGSSIKWVYQDTARAHGEILHRAANIVAGAEAQLSGRRGGYTVFNPSSYSRTEVVDLPGGDLAKVSLPGCSWAPLTTAITAPDGGVHVGDGWMDNSRLRVSWDSSGLLTSIWDHEAEREVLAPGARGNVFQIHEDHPRAFDAWEVERDYLRTCEDILSVDSLEIVEDRGLRAGVRVDRGFGTSGSRITQVMTLSADSRRIEFRTEVDWHERHKFLKVAFPVGVRSSRATYEIQHGHIERPTVENTSWDQARFEVSAHRWADLSEPGYGVALLNDCKYGYDIRGNVMRLSLLRAPGYPDADADQGLNRFRYALLPHLGDLRFDGRVVEEAEAFNLGIAIVPGQADGRILSLDRDGVSVEAVKWADRRDGVIVRLCEVWGRRGTVRVKLHVPFTAVHRTDLLERDLGPVSHDHDTAGVFLRPFELVTIHFGFGADRSASSVAASL